MNYCFPKGTVHPYESLWSIVHKFAHWNHCDVQDIQASFHLNRNLKGGWYIPTLLKCPRWDKERLAAILNIDLQAIVEGVIETYLGDNEISLLSSNNIRYCSECISLGYHSTIHQILVFEICPHHQLELKENCLKCGAIIDPGLNSRAIANYYACQRCDELLYDFNQTRSADIIDLLKSFKETADVLLLRKERVECRSSLGPEGIRSPIIQRLWPFWRCVYGEGEAEGVEISSIDRDRNESKLNIIDEYKDALRSIKQEIINHTDCINLLLLKGGWLGYLSLDKIDGVCEVAYAHIIWRLYWESEDYFSSMGSIDGLKKEEDISHVYVANYTFHLSKRVTKAVFDYECQSTWLSSLRYARSMANKSEFGLPGSLLPQLVKSYWEVSTEGDEKKYIFARLQLPATRESIPPFSRLHLDKMARALSSFHEKKYDHVRNLMLR